MGRIFNIQRFSIHDGPGIRTTVFFKGCNLNCLWCHNPESIPFQKQIKFDSGRCILCGRCFDACPNGAHALDEGGAHRIDRQRCVGCMACAECCFAEALISLGQDVTTEELMRSVLTDLPYYRSSGGGVTFSGGECMLQIDFLAQMLRLCKEADLHTAVDTAGNLPWDCFERILDDTDLFLYDIKAADDALHRKLTGSGNGRIIGNLYRLSAAGKRIFVRIPLVPGYNDGEIGEIGELLRKAAPERVEVLPYHRLGEGKCAQLGMSAGRARIEIPTEEQIILAVDALKRRGLNAVKA